MQQKVMLLLWAAQRKVTACSGRGVGSIYAARPSYYAQVKINGELPPPPTGHSAGWAPLR
jgi:hypothetical protein